MRTKLHLATVFLTGLCVGSISYNFVKNAYNTNNSRIIAEKNSQENLERYQRLLNKERERLITLREEKAAPELHVISINRGFKITGDRSNRGRAVVSVDRPGKKVVLFLSANSPVLWQINPTATTEITKIILSGAPGQKLSGNIANISSIEQAYYDNYRPRYLRAPQSKYANNFPLFVRQINQITGLEIASFQAANISNFERPFQVNNKQNDRLLSSNYPLVDRSCGLPKTTFKGLYRVDNSVSFGEYSLTAGPDLNNFIPVKVSQITYSPSNNKYYGIQNGRYLVEIDPNTQATRAIPIQNRYLKASYLRGITIDTKRNRLLIYDRSNRGSLYTYSLDTRQWNKINLNATSLTSIVYHAEEDAIYALKANYNSHRDRNYLTLYKLNSNGAVIDIINFSDTSLAGLLDSYSRSQLQLISSGKNLILVLGAKNSQTNSYNRGSIEPRIYLIDPITKQVKLTWKDTTKLENIPR